MFKFSKIKYVNAYTTDFVFSSYNIPNLKKTKEILENMSIVLDNLLEERLKYYSDILAKYELKAQIICQLENIKVNKFINDKVINSGVKLNNKITEYIGSDIPYLNGLGVQVFEPETGYEHSCKCILLNKEHIDDNNFGRKFHYLVMREINLNEYMKNLNYEKKYFNEIKKEFFILKKEQNK